MKLDSVSEAKLSLINPRVAEQIRVLAEKLSLENIHIKVTQGLRSWTEQQKLYNQGRTAPGNVVTNAKAGSSWHNFGLACDVAVLNPDGSFDWNASHPQWKRTASAGESLGLTSGSTFRSFPDWPHFQLTGKFPISPNDEVRSIFLQAGMLAVWEEAGLLIN